MGRGRAKAKQTKVARDLKYHSPATDYKQLERELSGRGASSERFGVASDDEESFEEDSYAEDPYAEDSDEDADDPD